MRPDIIKAFTPSIEARGHGGGSCLFHRSNLNVNYLPCLDYTFIVSLFSFKSRYVAIQLNRLNWRDFLSSQNPVAAALMAKMKIQPEDRPKVKAECLRLLATLRLNSAKMQLISGFVDTYLRLNEAEEVAFEDR